MTFSLFFSLLVLNKTRFLTRSEHALAFHQVKLWTRLNVNPSFKDHSSSLCSSARFVSATCWQNALKTCWGWVCFIWFVLEHFRLVLWLCLHEIQLIHSFSESYLRNTECKAWIQPYRVPVYYNAPFKVACLESWKEMWAWGEQAKFHKGSNPRSPLNQGSWNWRQQLLPSQKSPRTVSFLSYLTIWKIPVQYKYGLVCTDHKVSKYGLT